MQQFDYQNIICNACNSILKLKYKIIKKYILFVALIFFLIIYDWSLRGEGKVEERGRMFYRPPFPDFSR